MPKKEVKEAELSEREARWSAFEEAYAKQNPAKYEAKKAAGHFDKIPVDFA